MSLSKRGCAGSVLAFAGALLMQAGDVTAQDAGGRFTMTPSPEGLVRLDTETGAVSLCAKQNGEWACRALPDDQKALQDRVGKLEDENRALKDENRRLEDVMGLNSPGGAPSSPGQGPGPGGVGKIPVPTEKDVDQAFDYVEGMLRKFRERLKRLDEPGIDGPGNDGPGRDDGPRAPMPPSDPRDDDGTNRDSRRGTSL